MKALRVMFCNLGTTKKGIMPGLDAPANAVAAHAAGEAHSSNRVARHVAGVTFDVCLVRCAVVPRLVPLSGGSMRDGGLEWLSGSFRVLCQPCSRQRRTSCTRLHSIAAWSAG